MEASIRYAYDNNNLGLRKRDLILIINLNILLFQETDLLTGEPWTTSKDFWLVAIQAVGLGAEQESSLRIIYDQHKIEARDRESKLRSACIE